MIKKNNKKNSDTNSSPSLNHSTKKFEIFKSRVANAVLDYMEAQSDLDLLKCLEKSSHFLINISDQMERVFDNQKQDTKDENDIFEIGDDLFSSSLQTSSDTIH